MYPSTLPVRRILAVGILALSAVLAFASPVSAWSTKEHIQFTRLAFERLIADPTTPPEMKAWLEKALPEIKTLDQEREWFMNTPIGAEPTGYKGLLFWAFEPDITANKGPKDVLVSPFGVHERLTHFIDLELFLGGDAKRAYRDDLSGKPKFEDIPNDPTDPRFIQAGVLPMRIPQVYGFLVAALKAGKLEPKDDADSDNAVKWAGYLAHYLADNTQPQHSTIDYKSSVYFNERRNSPNVHAEVEYQMADNPNVPNMELRAEYWKLFEKQLTDFKDPVDTDDLFKATLQVSLKSYDALPLIGKAAVAAYGSPTSDHPNKIDTAAFFRFKGDMDGQPTTVAEMKARQTAWAVKRIERVIKQAWVESQKPQ